MCDKFITNFIYIYTFCVYLLLKLIKKNKKTNIMGCGCKKRKTVKPNVRKTVKPNVRETVAPKTPPKSKD